MLSLAISLASLAPASEPGWPKPDERIPCGPAVLEVYVSATAHVFHVVDQLSAWDDACHGHYRAHMPLSDEDEEALRAYAAVRQKRRWGQGLEQTFYVPLAVDAAIEAGVRAGDLTGAEAEVIRPVLARFTPRAEELLASKRALLTGAFASIDRARLTKAAQEIARFTGVEELVVPTFPLASPSAGGGAMDGGRLRWEISSDVVSFSTLVHELTHGFVMQKNDLLQATVEKTPGLTMTLLGEGIAYAMAPGLYPDGDDDHLASSYAQDRKNDTAWKDDGPGRFRMYALGLRPLYRDALESGTLEEFLPRARDVFLALHALETARERAGPPKLAIGGPLGDVVRERLRDTRFRYWIWWVDHDSRKYADLVPKLGPNDLFVLLVAADHPQRVPVAYASLSPMPLDEIDRRLARGETIAVASESTSPRVVLLAAPTVAALRELARTSALLAER